MSKSRDSVKAAGHYIINGSVLAIDPSIGSSSSLPGYAIYEKGELIEAGILDVPRNEKSVPKRLQILADIMRTEFKAVDVLIIEEVPPMRVGAFSNPSAHASLLKAIGCIIGATRANQVVELHPVTWTRLVDSDYVKGDDMDAIYIGKGAIQIAREAELDNIKRGKRGKK